MQRLTVYWMYNVVDTLYSMCAKFSRSLWQKMYFENKFRTKLKHQNSIDTHIVTRFDCLFLWKQWHDKDWSKLHEHQMSNSPWSAERLHSIYFTSRTYKDEELQHTNEQSHWSSKDQRCESLRVHRDSIDTCMSAGLGCCWREIPKWANLSYLELLSVILLSFDFFLELSDYQP